MLDILFKLWSVLSALWRGLPEKTKDDIMKKMADAMEDTLRRYHADAKDKASAA